MSIDEFAALRASRMVAGDVDQSVLDFLAETSTGITVRGLETVGRANQEADNLPGLSRLTLPAYVLHAELDRVIKADRTAALLTAMPNATEIRLPGVGHAPYVEDAAGYNAVIRRILSEVF